VDTFCISVTGTAVPYMRLFADLPVPSVCLSVCDFFCITCHFWRISIRKMVILVSYAEYWCFVRCARYKHLKWNNNDVRPTSNQSTTREDLCLLSGSAVASFAMDGNELQRKVWRQFSTRSPTVAETSTRYDQNNPSTDMVTTDRMTLVAFWLAAMITFIALFTYTWSCVYSNAYCVNALLWKINTHIHVRTKVNFAFL